MQEKALGRKVTPHPPTPPPRAPSTPWGCSTPVFFPPLIPKSCNPSANAPVWRGGAGGDVLMPSLPPGAGVSPQSPSPSSSTRAFSSRGGQISSEQQHFQGKMMLAPGKCGSFWEEMEKHALFSLRNNSQTILVTAFF